MPITVGDKIPDVVVYEETMDNPINLRELCAGRRVIIFGVPGAFTPQCSNVHLPSYIERYADFIEHGIDELVCISVNDPYVMSAWGNHQHVNGKVRMLSDTFGAFIKATDLQCDLTSAVGSVRFNRFTMIVTDGSIKALEVEPDGMSVTCTHANRIIDKVKSVK